MKKTISITGSYGFIVHHLCDCFTTTKKMTRKYFKIY